MSWDWGDIGATVATGGLYGAAKVGYEGATGNNMNLGGGLSDAFNNYKEGQQSNFQYHGYDTSPNYDPGAFNFGGYAGGAIPWQMGAMQGQGDADFRGGQLTQYGLDAQGRTVNENDVLSNRYNKAISEMQGATDLDRQAAEGNAPSAAAYMMQKGLNDSMAGQTSMAGSARGSAALAQAQSNAQSNVANMQQNAFTSAGQLRAQEMAQARGAYDQQSAALANMQQNRLQMGNQMSQFNRNANDAFTNNMVNSGLGYGQLGQGYFGQGIGVAQQQGQARQGLQGMLNGDWQNGQQMQAGVNLYNTNSNKDIVNQFTGMGKGMGGSLMGMGSGGGGQPGGGTINWG